MIPRKSLWKFTLVVAGTAAIVGPPSVWWVCRRELAGGKQLESVSALQTSASRGDAKAEFDLGIRYYEGRGVLKDYAEAARWYRKAAEQGDAKAQFNLGDMYFRGKGVPQDYKEAIDWIQKAANQGNTRAEAGLGYIYFNGVGSPRDDAEAVRWYRRAANGGEPTAQAALGYMYSNGQGLPRNRDEALQWYRKAAAQGDSDAKQAIRSLNGESRTTIHTRWMEFVAAILALSVGLWALLGSLLHRRRLRDLRQGAITLMGLCFLLGGGLSLYALEMDGLQYSAHHEIFMIARFLSTGIAVLILLTIVLPSKKTTRRNNRMS